MAITEPSTERPAEVPAEKQEVEMLERVESDPEKIPVDSSLKDRLRVNVDGREVTDEGPFKVTLPMPSLGQH